MSRETVLRRRLLRFLGVGLLTAGCAYYNGMYNANRLARAAEKPEREGRTFDANSLWGQVGVKSDTVLARHRGSKWTDDALLLRGKAYQRLGDCESAVKPLNEVVATSLDRSLVEEASFLLGRCYQVLGNTAQANEAFARLLNSADPARRNEALFQHGRSLRLGGQYAEALAALQQTADPRAAGERAAALAGLGRLPEAGVVTDSLIAAADTTAPWDDILSLIGQHDAWAASGMVDQLIALRQAIPEQRVRWLVADGERLGASNPAAAEARLAQAIALGGGSTTSARAQLSLLRLRLGRATVDSLGNLLSDLADLLQTGGEISLKAGRLSRGVADVMRSADTVAHGASAGDMRLFLAAETARDTLVSTGIAVTLFRRVAQEYEASPYAPKALLALAAIDSAGAEAALETLHAKYPDSPYLAAAAGRDAPRYTALEDSMRLFAVSLRALLRPGASPAGTRPPPPSSTRLPEN